MPVLTTRPTAFLNPTPPDPTLLLSKPPNKCQKCKKTIVDTISSLYKKFLIADSILTELQFSIVGISSGASAPEQLVQDLISKIKNKRDISLEEITVAEEKVIFKIPKELN